MLPAGNTARFEVYSITNRGGRESNQDACGDAEIGSARCWVVADGLGGHLAGARAAQLCVDTVLQSFRSEPSVTPEALQRHFSAAQDAVTHAQLEHLSCSNMQSTLVVLVSDGSQAIWGHAGDTRLYHLRAGRIERQTLDHTVSQAKLAAGDLGFDDVRQDEDRNRLLQAVGKQGGVRPTIQESPCALNRNDAFLLCVDGFWNRVYEPEIEIDLAKALSAEGWVRGMRQRLASRLRPGDDNYTALVVRSTDPSLPPGPEDPYDNSVGASSRPGKMEISALVAGVLLSVLLGIGVVAIPVPQTGKVTGIDNKPVQQGLPSSVPSRAKGKKSTTPPGTYSTASANTDQPPKPGSNSTQSACNWTEAGALEGCKGHGNFAVNPNGISINTGCGRTEWLKYSAIRKLESHGRTLRLLLKRGNDLVFKTDRNIAREVACVNRQAERAVRQ